MVCLYHPTILILNHPRGAAFHIRITKREGHSLICALKMRFEKPFSLNYQIAGAPF